VPWIAVDFDGWWFEEARAPRTGTSRLAMQPAEVTAALTRILDAAPMSRVVVSTADLDDRLRRWIGAHDPAAMAPPSPVAAPAVATRRAGGDYAAPATGTEARLAAMWSECFGIEQVGTRDDFFELGGHSLLGTQLMSRVRDTFAVDLALGALFAAPTIAALAAKVDGRLEELAGRQRERAALLERVTALSPEERARLLKDARQSKERAG
jgi:hypothetical protein